MASSLTALTPYRGTGFTLLAINLRLIRNIMKTTQTIGALALGAFLLTMPVAYATGHSSAATAQQQSLTEGEIRKVDKEAKKLTIRHGPLQNLDMPAMTMVFQVADPSILDRVKPGDKVRFAADKVDGVYTVTGLEQVK
jgi:Cu(I)/Ag(I) efflux system periplasmic protein CusF